ncbi:hypothetical protein [Cerasicoccus arenae]|uniref:Leucine rich repeat variant n=1 Tax=Cerasicoccus arenae TaxID=424488 RepID=A0A8J3GEF0_9BACT|nr:hypothetical protein [Cerasicoccus arenae]MBK1858690.1 hypothetical protein [Cerasicoccus arenae]GHB98338.1 hypothetical protein GCM10007047_13010 [Cerasicoccus arenae]
MQLPQTTNELLALIHEHGPQAIARRFRKPPISSQLLRTISQENPPEEAWIFLTSYALTPSSLLEEIGAHQADYPSSVLIPLAQNPRTPPGALSILVQHDESSVRAAALTNPNLPPRDADSILTEKDQRLWRSLAANPALKLKSQAVLAARGDASVRLELVHNKSLHPDLLIALSADPSPLVRCTLVASVAAPDDVLLFWADSDREEIQIALLTRTSLPKKILRTLLFSPHASVRKAVRMHRELDEIELLYLSRSETNEDREFVAAHQGIPPGLQHELAQDPETDIRNALAANPAIWPEMAEFFVTGEDTSACLSLLDNPAMPPALFLELAWMNHASVTAALASHQETPEEVLQYLANERLSATALAHMAACRRSASWLRPSLAEALAQHASPSIRALAASSQLLPAKARNHLRDDPADFVRTLAYEVTPPPVDEEDHVPKAKIQQCLNELTAIVNGIDSEPSSTANL